MTHRGDAYLAFFETLTPESLHDLDTLVTDDIRFCDPFNDVRGKGAMRQVFERAFEDVDDPRFLVLRRAWDGDVCLVLWRFSGRLKRLRRAFAFDGMSELHFDGEGRVSSHMDYWDAAGHIYEQIPLLGRVLRTIRKRAAIS